MTERIRRLTELTLSGKMYPDVTITEFEKTDILLSKQENESKRICKYILKAFILKQK